MPGVRPSRFKADRPPVDRSYVSNDLSAFVPAREPAAIDRDMTLTREAEAYEKNLRDRDERDAKMLGIDINVYRQIPGDVKERMLAQAPGQKLPEWSESNFKSVGELEIGGSVEAVAQKFESFRQSMITPEQEKEYVVLCRPVVDDPRWGRVTPGVARIKRDMMAKKVLLGFSYAPQAPFPPEPDVACDYPGLQEPRCTYKGYSDVDDPSHSTEVELHARSKHPRMYEARTAQALRLNQEQQRRRDEQQLKMLELQVKLMEKQLAVSNAQTQEIIAGKGVHT